MSSSPIRAWRPGRLPVQPGPLVGRENELHAIRHLLLEQGVRLLTLWGPAGIGKTRLALAVATDAELRQSFQDVVFVDLAPIREPGNVVPTIAEAFGLGQASYTFLLDHIESSLGHRPVLLILDNVEHVLAFAHELAPLLVSCPSLVVLTTSRASLGLRWEYAFPVPPLPVPYHRLPNDATTAATYAGVALFVERARAARPDFQLTDANASVVADVCARLDGVPLALELAATRTKGLPLLVLLKRLDDRLALLHSGAPDLPARQQTLRRALTWSYDLLNQDQQAVFRRLGVFVDGCSPDAAEAVCSGGELETDVLEALATLVQHSLLRLEEVAGGQARYTMLATIRDYALELLTRSGEAEEIRRRHAAHYLALAEAADAQLDGPAQAEWLDHLEREHGNLRTALRWAIVCDQAEHGMRLGAALRRFWSIRGHLAEGRSWLRQVLALPQPAHVSPALARGLAAAAAGWLAEDQGDYADATSLQEQSLALCREAGDQQGTASALHRLGVLAKYAGDPVTARARFEESLGLAQAIGWTPGVSSVLQDLGGLCVEEGDLDCARRYFEQSLAMRRELSDTHGIALALLGLARVALSQRDFNITRSLLEEALGILRRLGDHQSIASVLEVFACLAARRGGTGRALRLVGAAESLRTAVGAHPTPDWRPDVEAHQKVADEELDQAGQKATQAEGRSLALDEAIQLCLEDETLVRASACPKEVLVNGCLEEFTPREREVIQLAVRGWSNRQIASELVISERTAEGHIHNILSKLQLGSRAQLVAWGARLGLVMTEQDLLSRELAS